MTGSVAVGTVKRWSSVALFVLCAASPASGGDYRLTVANDPHAPCIRGPAAQGHRDWPVVTAREVSDDLLRYFHGQKPRLELFVPYFTNARITFCGAAERTEVYGTLVAVLRLPSIQNEWDLYDYCFMLGSRELLTLIDHELDRRPGPTGPSLERLRRARAAVSRGMAARRQR